MHGQMELPALRFVFADSYDKTIVVDTKARRVVATCDEQEDAALIAALLNAKAKGD